jgi:hypothetical protein
MTGNVLAQSNLPSCPKNGTWNNCFGVHVRPDGITYVGEYQNDQRHGNGIEYWPNGLISRSGLWSNSTLAKSFSLNADSNVSAFATVDPSTSALSQSNLPPCPPSGTWNNCFGKHARPDGVTYVGEYQNDQRHGNGIEYGVNGSVSRSGLWSHSTFTKSYSLVANHYPLNVYPQASALPTVDPVNIERDRLKAEVESERKKRQELEQLLANTKDREKFLSELDAERRKLQEVEAELNRSKDLAESRLTERPPPQTAQRAERRVALVIGNAQYKSSPLENSVNDATDIDQALKRFGFQTTFLRDASLGRMREATRRFADQLTNADVALIYFAGHGVESKNKNFMIPVNADLKFEYELADQAYDAAAWLEMLETIKSNNAERVNIVILDACRNNNLIGSRSLNRGLARMDAPTGTFLSYSTAPGKVAADGGKGERNSPFTKNLLKAIQQPGKPIEEVFKEVRRNVTRETNGAQVPWESTSLTGFFSFRQAR